MSTRDTIIKNKNSTAELIDDRIFYLNYHAGSYSEVTDFEEGCEAFEILTQGRPIRVLVEMGRHANLSSDAREFAQANKKPAMAEALVLHSLPQRLIFNFYVRFRKQDHPIKIFSDFNLAKDWLNTFLNKKKRHQINDTVLCCILKQNYYFVTHLLSSFYHLISQ
jgi:hypothetical protein